MPTAKNAKVAVQPKIEANFSIPIIKLPQPDGSILVKAGKPIVCAPFVSVAEFSKATTLSMRYIEQLCEEGRLKHRRLTDKPHSKILINRDELARYMALEGEI